MNPVKPAAPKKLMTNPPMSAPTMPVTMFLMRLPSVFMIMFAIQPAKPPMMIHTMMLIFVPFRKNQWLMHPRIDERTAQHTSSRQPVCPLLAGCFA